MRAKRAAVIGLSIEAPLLSEGGHAFLVVLGHEHALIGRRLGRLLSRLENGKSGVSTDRVLKVLDGLGLSMVIVEKAKLRRTIAAANSADL